MGTKREDPIRRILVRLLDTYMSAYDQLEPRGGSISLDEAVEEISKIFRDK